jgi:hypothetical protein
MNVSNTTATSEYPIVQTSRGILVFLAICIFGLLFAALLLFGGIRKRNALFLCCSWIGLRCYTCCCKRSKHYQERVLQKSDELKDILDHTAEESYEDEDEPRFGLE